MMKMDQFVFLENINEYGIFLLSPSLLSISIKSIQRYQLKET